MEEATEIKALFIIVNAGFADDIVDMARELGAGGATIINSRGGGAVTKSVMGITVDIEKEMIMSLVETETAERIMAAVKEKAGLKTPADGICFILPVDKMTNINTFMRRDNNTGESQ